MNSSLAAPDYHDNGSDRVLHLSNGAIIALISMVVVTFVSLFGLLLLYVACHRRHRQLQLRDPESQPRELSTAEQPDSKQVVTHGMTLDEIRRLPLLTIGRLVELIGSEHASTTCAVCLAEFATEQGIRFLPECKHCFHPECVDKWLFASASCPLCRCNLSELSMTGSTYALTTMDTIPSPQEQVSAATASQSQSLSE